VVWEWVSQDNGLEVDTSFFFFTDVFYIILIILFNYCTLVRSVVLKVLCFRHGIQERGRVTAARLPQGISFSHRIGIIFFFMIRNPIFV